MCIFVLYKERYMEKMFEISDKHIRNTDTTFLRYLHSEINWNNRLIAIKGARGAGKTTLILQHIKLNYPIGNEVIYASLDSLYFSNNRLLDFADGFVKNGGKFLFLDEVHKYPNWSQEIKNIYDQFPELKIVFTSSSLLQIYKGYADLSRRVVSYNLNELSFREYLEFELKIKYSPLSLDEIVHNHRDAVQAILVDIKPLAEFKKYLEHGTYPFYKESVTDYYQKIANVINLVIETDLPSVVNIEYSSIIKLKKLLYIISKSVPFTPNIQKLSELIETNRASVLQFIDYLNNAQIINLLYSDNGGLSYLKKPEKIFLANTNLMYALAPETANTGNLRETFFLNQLGCSNSVTSAEKGDFKINNKMIFEIGGKNKDFYQIQDIENSFLAIDNIETGINHKIPLWLFGFMY